MDVTLHTTVLINHPTLKQWLDDLKKIDQLRLNAMDRPIQGAEDSKAPRTTVDQ